jgi:outer membrane protein
MKFQATKSVLFIVLSSVALSSQAANLVRVYSDAVSHDPTFQRAEATWHAEQQNTDIARSGYLPQVDITGSIMDQYQKTRISIPLLLTSETNATLQYQVTATQPIFNAANWFNIKKAGATVRAATASYSYAAQNLMLRTAQAYFAVLQAYDQLITTQASKRAYYREFVTAKQKFEVGLIAKTGVYEAESYYDGAIASELADQNFLYDKIESLRAITGFHYGSLQGVKTQVPLIIPAPNDINIWVQTAQSQNYGLIADQFQMIAAHENIRQTSAGNYPVVDAQATWTQVVTNGHPSLGPLFTINGEAAQGGVSMNFPLVQGGYVVASTRQAIYQYGETSSQFDMDNAATVTSTRQSFLGIVSGVGQIKADKQAIISAENALQATRAGYTVGTRTMVDVLTDTSNLYKAKQRYYDDQYLYLINIFNLKYAAGTLAPQDFVKINSWLNQRMYFALPAKLFDSVTRAPTIRLQTEKANIPIIQVVSERADLPPPSQARPYFLQLYSSTNRAGAEHFIREYPRWKSHLRIVHHENYYRVVYGEYPNYQAARMAGVELTKKGLSYFLISRV